MQATLVGSHACTEHKSGFRSRVRLGAMQGSGNYVELQ